MSRRRDRAQQALSALWREPVGFPRRVIQKLLVEPARYRRGEGYDAGTYWADRLRQGQLSNDGAGNHAVSTQQVEREREALVRQLLSACAEGGVPLQGADVLEIGVGDGYLARRLRDEGVAQYRGVDITDALFEHYQRIDPRWRFEVRDVTADPLEGRHDLVLMLYVIIHIVERDKLDFALRNVASRVRPGGLLVLAPVSLDSRRELYYVHTWTKEDILPHFQDFESARLLPLGDHSVLVARR